MSRPSPLPPVERTTLLTDFRSFHEDRAIPQARLNAYIAWLMACARSVAEATTSEAEARAHFEAARALVARFGVKPEYVGARVMLTFPPELRVGERPDPCSPYPEGFADLGRSALGSSVAERMRSFATRVSAFLADAYPERSPEPPPEDIVHVTCAGYLAPNPIEQMVAARRWPTTVTNSYHMGCYGAFPAVRIANGIVSAGTTTLPRPKLRVDVLHTELLSLHTELHDHSVGNVITMTLFGDGFIRYSLVCESSFEPPRPGLRLRAASESLIPGSSTQMSWELGPHTFHMYLSPEVPVFIRDHVEALVDELARQVGVTRRVLLDTAVFAIHPGGPRIVRLVQERLGVSESKVRHSRAVLRARGNMSSATVPYIWKAILDDSLVRPGTPIVSLAFGPGLTAAGLLLEKVGSAEHLEVVR
jgi:alkylresorcinol/alkylpyrone synthase